MIPRPAVHVVGTPAHFLNADELIGTLTTAVEERRPMLVFHQNLHGAYLQRRDPEYRRLFDRVDLAYVDGMPFVWLGRVAGHSVDRTHRTTYLDWEDRFLERCATEGWRVFYVGGRQESLDAGMATLRDRHPGLLIDGHHGYFDQSAGSADSRGVVDAANRFDAAFVLVGLGMPLQERWAAAHRADLDAPVVLTIGAAIDYASGQIASPPRWAGRLGLEWLARLIHEPRRLGSRYLVEPLWLVGPAVAGVIRSRRS